MTKFLCYILCYILCYMVKLLCYMAEKKKALKTVYFVGFQCLFVRYLCIFVMRLVIRLGFEPKTPTLKV